MEVVNTIDALLKAGFTKRFAQKYLDDINSENPLDYDSVFFDWAHSHGFCANHAICMGINSNNVSEYISDYDYYRTWPNDSWLKMWHNDKLTLKYMLNGTKYAHYMPEYYFYYLPSHDGKASSLHRLIDCPKTGQSFEDFIFVLQEKKRFACKPNNGGRSVGFHKMEYKDDSGFFLDNEKVVEGEIIEFIKRNPNYIYTEYLFAGYGMEKIHQNIHTIRVNILNEDGINPYHLGSYIRFPTDSMGGANYNSDMRDEDCFFYCKIDINTGRISDGIRWYKNRSVQSNIHPQTGREVCGILPFWSEIHVDSMEMAKLFFGTEILGFDFGISSNGPKLMEINSFPHVAGAVQLYYPLMKNVRFKSYIQKKLNYINNLSEKEILKRNMITN